MLKHTNLRNALVAAAVASLSALAVAGALPSQSAHGSTQPASGYTHIDNSAHPTNPARCYSRSGC
ncbi:MAG: hypothetical protein QOE58_1045 [Actinomycetota bacterium]|jgi:hypothetical protein|nr:hypothetical protein [Actinomycetota bacterium]